ncbi:hypothetical protein FQZ97_1078300 [compost metagenome]
MRRQDCVHACEQRGFEVFAFGAVFLDEVHAGQRGFKVRFERQRVGRGAGQYVAQFRQHGPRCLHADARLGFGVGGRIADDHFQAAGKEQRGPAGADGAGAHDGDAADGGRKRRGGTGHAGLLVAWIGAL